MVLPSSTKSPSSQAMDFITPGMGAAIGCEIGPPREGTQSDVMA